MSPAVRMIVNVLRLATQPMTVTMPGGEVDADGEPLTEINPTYRRWRMAHRFELCRFDTVQQTDENGEPLFAPDGSPLMRRLTDSEALKKAVDATSAMPGESRDELQQQIDNEIRALASMDSPTLMSMTERIIERFMTLEARQRENAFITAFQDLVLDFSENGNNSIRSFLEWWDRTGRFSNVAAPEGIDAISVMTIHKAKGLEFGCVHLPYCSDKPVKYNEKAVRSVSWYTLSPEFIPEVDAADIPPMLPLPNERGNKEIGALRAEAEEWETEQKTDALNVAYVAFTRAVAEMVVYVDNSPLLDAEAKGKAKGGTPGAGDMLMGDYLLSALRAMNPEKLASAEIADDIRPWLTPLSTGLHRLESGELEFTLGEPTAPRGEGKKTGDGSGERRFEGLLDEYTVHERSEICASMDFEDLLEFDIDDDRHRGIFLHAVLSRVRRPDDLDTALGEMAYRYKIDEEHIAECRAILADALADERVRPWFEGFRRVLNERPLTAPQSLRRPDRVVWTADGSVAVVDYKFGVRNHRGYYEQVRDYMSLLEQAGQTDVHGYLWFPLTHTIIEVQ